MARYSDGVDKAGKFKTSDNADAKGARTMSTDYKGDGEVSTSKPGSHQTSHEKLGGARKAIVEGSPEEQAKHVRKGEGGK